MPIPSKRLSACLALLVGLFGLALIFLRGYRPPQDGVAPMVHSAGTGQGVARSVKIFTLGQEKAATRQLPPLEVHRYTFFLRSGDFLEVAADQDPVQGEEIDLACRLYAPDGFWYEVDNPTDARGSEYVRLVADLTGVYQIEVDGSPKPGIYRLRQVTLRRADARDRANARAERFFYMARTLGEQKAFEQALTTYREAQGLWHGIGNREGEASAIDRSARLFVENGLGDWDKVENLWSEALHIWLSTHNTKEVVNSLVGLGQAQGKLAKFEQAEENLREAIHVASQLSDPKFKAKALETLAVTTGARGDPVSAHELYGQALFLWEKSKRPEDQSRVLTALGQIDLSMGNVALARQFFLRADGLLAKIVDDRFRAKSLSRLCELYTRMGNLDWALVYGNQAVALRKKVGDMRGEAVSLTDLAGVYRKKGDIKRARAAQEDALALYLRSKDRQGEAIAHYHLGLIFLEERSLLLAAERFEAALKIARELRYNEGEILALYGLSLTQQARGNPRQARRWIEQALPLIEFAPQSTGSDENSASTVATLGTYELLISLLVSDPAKYTSVSDRAASFAASERARWRSLREWLFAAQDSSLKSNAKDDPQLQQLKEAVPEDNADVPSEEGKKSVDDDSAAQIESIRMREAEIHRKTVWSAASTSASVTLPQAQELLDSETVLLEYFLGTSRSYLWMVTPKTVEVFALPGRELIEEECKKFYDLLADSRSQSREQQAAFLSQELSKMLLGPLTDRLSDKRLVIIRDGAINYVPFAALAEPSSGSVPWTGHGKAPLIFRHEIVYLPSASVLLALRREPRNRLPPPGLMAVIADPVFTGGMYEPLPYSRLEGERLSQLAAKQGRVLSAYGFAATRDLVMSGGLNQFRYLVFATHGINDPIHPELSAIVLSQRGPKGQLLKGHLRVQDIKALNLRSDLVFLSGCRTSLGSNLVGEGFMGLSQSFMYAGVPRVIANLWNVREEATPAFSEHVFRSILLEGVPPSMALREAQVWMARESEWRSPFYWAGFEIQGDWR